MLLDRCAGRGANRLAMCTIRIERCNDSHKSIDIRGVW
jgi:hypothetical protein